MTDSPHAFGVGLFADFLTFTIPSDVNLVRTSGYKKPDSAWPEGLGSALYARISDSPTPTASSSVAKDADDNWWRLCEDVVTPQMFGARGDGAVNDTQALKDAIAFANGGQVYMPGGVYVVNDRIEVLSTANPGSAFGPGLHLIGAGMAETVIDNQCSGKNLFFLDATHVEDAYRAQMGAKVANLTVDRRTSGTGSSAFELVNAYQVQFDQVMITRQRGSGIILRNGLFVDDGWNSVALSNLWIDGCTGWGIDATGGYARNEGSFSKFHNVFIQSCGTNEYFTVSNITDAVEAEVSVLLAQLPRTFPQVVEHPFKAGDRIKLFGVEGMTEVNDVIYKVGPEPSATGFKLYTNVTASTEPGVPVALDSDPFTTTVDSRVVTVEAENHGAIPGDFVTLDGADPVGGLTLDGVFEIITATEDAFTIYSNTPAETAEVGGGDGVTAAYALSEPVDTTEFGAFSSGMASAALGLDPFATVAESLDVTVTDIGHSAVKGGVVAFSGADAVGGLNLNGSFPIISVIDADTYVIQVAAPAATDTETGGGETVTAQYADGPTKQAEVSYLDPRSGGLRWKGQLLHLLSCGFTTNQNVAQFIPGDAGLATGALCEQVTWENSFRRHVYCTGIDSFTSIASQFHGAEQFPTWVGVEFNGWRYLVRGVSWDGTAVRSSRNRSLQWKLAGANTNVASCRVRRTMWQDFDYVGQRRFEGWQFDQIEEDCIIRSEGPTAISFGPRENYATGNKTAVRLRGPAAQRAEEPAYPAEESTTGEWVEYNVPASGVIKTNAGLETNKLYDVYIYDNNGALALDLEVVPASEPSYIIDPSSGYPVRPSDDTMRWVGRMKTETASSNFITTNAGFTAPTPIGGTSPGISDMLWFDTGQRRLWYKGGAAPTTAGGGLYGMWATFEVGQSGFTPPSLAAGASQVYEMTASPTCNLGDYVVSVSFSLDQQGLLMSGYVSAANKITVVFSNPTTSTITLGSGILRASYQRR